MLSDKERFLLRSQKRELQAGKFWEETLGVVHIGGHIGQERFFYSDNKWPVL